MNNYQLINEKQLSSITGGNRWGNAVLGGLTGAKIGFKGCSKLEEFGPWVVAGCTVGATGIGAWVGYHKK